jgi:hypothetical protein
MSRADAGAIDLRACSGTAKPEFIGLGRVQHSQAPAASDRSWSHCQHLPINPRFRRSTDRHPQVDSLPPPLDHRSATREHNEIDDFGNRVRFGLASSFLPLLVRAPRDDLRNGRRRVRKLRTPSIRDSDCLPGATYKGGNRVGGDAHCTAVWITSGIALLFHWPKTIERAVFSVVFRIAPQPDGSHVDFWPGPQLPHPEDRP